MASRSKSLAEILLAVLTLSASGFHIVYHSPSPRVQEPGYVDVTGLPDGSVRIPVPDDGLTLFKALVQSGGTGRVSTGPAGTAPGESQPPPDPPPVEPPGPVLEDAAAPELESGGNLPADAASASTTESPPSVPEPMGEAAAAVIETGEDDPENPPASPEPPPLPEPNPGSTPPLTIETGGSDPGTPATPGAAAEPVPDSDTVRFVALRRRDGMIITRWLFPVPLVEDQLAGAILLRHGDTVSIIPQSRTPLHGTGLSFDLMKLKSPASEVEIFERKGSDSLLRDRIVLPAGTIGTNLASLQANGIEYDLFGTVRSERLEPVAASLITSSLFDEINRLKKQKQPSRRRLRVPVLTPLLDAIGSGVRDLSTIEIHRTER